MAGREVQRAQSVGPPDESPYRYDQQNGSQSEEDARDGRPGDWGNHGGQSHEAGHFLWQRLQALRHNKIYSGTLEITGRIPKMFVQD